MSDLGQCRNYVQISFDNMQMFLFIIIIYIPVSFCNAT